MGPGRRHYLVGVVDVGGTDHDLAVMAHHPLGGKRHGSRSRPRQEVEMARRKRGSATRSGVKLSAELLASLSQPWEQARIIVAAAWPHERGRPDDLHLAALRQAIASALQQHVSRKGRFRIRVVYGRMGYRSSPRMAKSTLIQMLVRDLAAGYEQVLGARPGRSDSGPFARLVRVACEALGEQPPRSVRHMLRHTGV